MPNTNRSRAAPRTARRYAALLAVAVATLPWLTACGSDAEPAESLDGSGQVAPAADGERVPGTPEGGLADWIDDIRATLDHLPVDSPAVARQRVLDAYIGRQEFIEMYYGAGGRLAPRAELVASVDEAEARFHELMQVLGQDPPPARERVAELINELNGQLDVVLDAAEVDGVPPAPPGASRSSIDEGRGEPVAGEGGGGGGTAAISGASAARAAPTSAARTTQIRAILGSLDEAEGALSDGRSREALRLVEAAYLEGFEPLESLLPGDRVYAIERLFHLSLRPALSGGSSADPVAVLTELRSELHAADAVLAEGSGRWFVTLNAFAIIFREGLEAVLLVGAILAYLRASGADPRHRRHVLYGVAAAIAASVGTWMLARTFVPIGGAQRELIEGVTALLAVGVLVYVSHWLFHKTYVQDWMSYLKRKVGGAVSTGSALAMVTLAFAAVYREGFETVLFYQALGNEAGAGAVMAGFVPGALAIVAVAWGMVRLGLRLPIKVVFGLTNAILLYLAFVFLGKGLYSLQEAGLFSPTPLAGLPANRGLELFLGYHPMAETLLPQAVFLTLLFATWVWYRRRVSAAKAASAARSRAASSSAEVTAA
ncbi:MAG TPA: FTR1 family protein [Longimicrobiales bacterium]|nr:FTR1 family protein [Longimicrobiales bacterium]